MSSVLHRFLLGLKFREQHSQVLQDEFDNLIAGIQTQLGTLGVLHKVARNDLVMTLEGGGRWLPSTFETLVSYAFFGELLYVSFGMSQTTFSANQRPRLQVPGGLKCQNDIFVYGSVLITTSSTGVNTPGYSVIEGRYSTPDQIIFGKLDGSAFSTTANDVSISGSLIFPYVRV